MDQMTIQRIVFNDNFQYIPEIMHQQNYMSKAGPEIPTQDPVQKPSINSINPRKAATKLKEANQHIETMKCRFKVLKVQDEYNRYRTIDQQKRINFHKEIHHKLQKDREIIRKSLEKINDTTEIKQKADELRVQIKQKIKEARKSLLDERIDRSNSINQQFLQHTLQIRQNKEKDIEANRERTLTVKYQQQQKRQSVSRHLDEKVRSIHLNKSIDSSNLSRKAQKRENQLSRMMVYQSELISKNSQSLQASQMMKHKFNQVFTTISSSNTSRLLPEIRVRTNNSKQTNNSTQV